MLSLQQCTASTHSVACLVRPASCIEELAAVAAAVAWSGIAGTGAKRGTKTAHTTVLGKACIYVRTERSSPKQIILHAIYCNRGVMSCLPAETVGTRL